MCGSPHARPHSVLGGCLSELLRLGTCSHRRGELTVAVEPLDLEWMSVMEACLEGQWAGEWGLPCVPFAAAYPRLEAWAGGFGHLACI